MESLTAEQMQRIAEKRKAALEIQARKKLEQQRAAASCAAQPSTSSNVANGAASFGARPTPFLPQNSTNNHSNNNNFNANGLSRFSANRPSFHSKYAFQPRGAATSNVSHQARPLRAPAPAGNQRLSQHSAAPSSSASGHSDPFVEAFRASTFGKPLEVTLGLFTRERFRVEFTFNAEFLSFVKSKSKSRAYDVSSRSWNIDFKEHKAFVDALQPLVKAGLVTLRDMPDHVKRLFTTKQPSSAANCSLSDGALASASYGDYDLQSRLDSALLESLYPYQRDGICFAISRNGKCMIADEMGLGKTIQALGVAAYYRKDWPLLVVCPSSMRYNWSEAVTRWLPSVDESSIYVITKERDYVPREKRDMVVVISYDLLVSMNVELAARRFGVMILDESHFIKNRKTQRCKSAVVIAKTAARILLLSGTPALSRPEELHSQVHLLRPSLFPSYHNYGLRYCAGQKAKFGWDFTGASNLEELRIVLEESIMIRRTKQDVLKQLPPKSRDAIILDKESVKSNIKAIQKAKDKMLLDNLRGVEKRAALLEFYHATAEAKQDAVVHGEYLQSLALLSIFIDQDGRTSKELPEDETLQVITAMTRISRAYVTEALDTIPKLLLFAHHQVMMDALSGALMQDGISFIRIDGSTPSEKRKKFCDEFQLLENIRVALLSITAANTGLTLTAAHVVIFCELFWNPGVLVQAEDRVHRIGQEENVQIRYLVARGTADDYLWTLLKQKVGTLTKAGLSKDNYDSAEIVFVRDTPDELANGSSLRASGLRTDKGQRRILDYFSELQEEELPGFSADGHACSDAVQNEANCQLQSDLATLSDVDYCNGDHDDDDDADFQSVASSRAAKKKRFG